MSLQIAPIENSTAARRWRCRRDATSGVGSVQKDAFRGRGAVVASSLLIVPRGEVTHEVRRGVPSCMIITFFRVLLGLVVCMVDSVDVEWLDS